MILTHKSVKLMVHLSLVQLTFILADTKTPLLLLVCFCCLKSIKNHKKKFKVNASIRLSFIMRVYNYDIRL